MELTSINEMSFEDNPDLPDVVYKYRVWSNDYHKSILSEQAIFMAPPTSFEDPKDCKLLKRYDLLTEEDIFNKYLQSSREDHPDWTRQQHRKFARDWTNKSPMKDPSHTKKMQEEYFLAFDERFGVLSLTANSANLDMWNKYSDLGKGFCVGFDPVIMFEHLGGGGVVSYYDSLPDIMPNDDFHLEHAKQVFSKEKKWVFEQEYRTHKFYPNPASTKDRQIVVPREAYREVIFGWALEQEAIEEILECCESNDLFPSFLIATLKEDDSISLSNYQA